MLSRTAQSVYWMSRYLERADNVARAIYVNVQLLLDLGLAAHPAQWEPLVISSGDEEEFAKRYDQANQANIIRFLTFDEENPNSILSAVRRARENARTVREIISSEMWETLNELYHYVQRHNEDGTLDLQRFCTKIRNYNHAFTGLTENTMSHGEGWHFARLGRMLERADKTARLLDVKYFFLLPDAEYVDTPYDAVEWGAVLKSANGFEMYRKQFHRINYKDVTRFLMFDADFPRSMRFSVTCARGSLRWITDAGGTAGHELDTIVTMLEQSSVEQVLTQGLHEFIDRFQLRLNDADEAINRAFFAINA